MFHQSRIIDIELLTELMRRFAEFMKSVQVWWKMRRRCEDVHVDWTVFKFACILRRRRDEDVWNAVYLRFLEEVDSCGAPSWENLKIETHETSFEIPPTEWQFSIEDYSEMGHICAAKILYHVKQD